jgi:hypothetical protein
METSKLKIKDKSDNLQISSVGYNKKLSIYQNLMKP